MSCQFPDPLNAKREEKSQNACRVYLNQNFYPDQIKGKPHDERMDA